MLVSVPLKEFTCIEISKCTFYFFGVIWACTCFKWIAYLVTDLHWCGENILVPHFQQDDSECQSSFPLVYLSLLLRPSPFLKYLFARQSGWQISLAQ